MATATTKKKAAPVPESENAPKWHVVDQTFVWLDDEQGEIRIPLRIKMKLLREMARLERDEGASDFEQLFAMLDALGNEQTAAQIDAMFVEDATPLIEAYFKAFEKANKATAGE